MNSDKPRTPRQELEASLTALLLGELPAEKAAALRELMAKDAELAKLHGRLEQAIGLVKETAASSEEETVAGPTLKMSGKKREQLLAHFKTVAPKEFAKQKRKHPNLVEIAAMVAILAMLAAALLPALSKAKSKSQQVHYASSGKRQIYSGQVGTDMIAGDAAAVRRPAEPVFDNGQDGVVLSGNGGGGGLGRPSQTIFERRYGENRGEIVVSQSAGKPANHQIVLPAASDYEINGKDASLGLQPQIPTSGVSGTFTTGITSQDAADSFYAISGGVQPQGMFDDSTTSARSTAGFGGIGTSATYADGGQGTGAIQKFDEVFRRRYGGVDRGDNAKSKSGDVALAEVTTEDLGRRKLQEESTKKSESKPVENIPAIAGVPPQTPAASTPIAGEKLAEVAQRSKDASGSNIYLGTELAKADNKFGTWALDNGAGGRISVPKKEEESLKQMGEVFDGVTVAGRVTTPVNREFTPLAPVATPAPSTSLAYDANGVTQSDMTKSFQPQQAPILGDVPMMGRAFRGGEKKSDASDRLLANDSLSVSQTNLETFGGIIAGVPSGNLSGYVNGDGQWQFTTGTANRGWLGGGKTNEFFADVSSNSNSFTERLQADGSGTGSYNRYTFDRNLQQLGLNGVEEPKLALSYTIVPDQDRPAERALEQQNKLGKSELAGPTNVTRLRDATLYFESGELDQAEALFKKAAKEDPNNRAARYYLDLIKDSRDRRALGDEEMVTRQSIVNSKLLTENAGKASSTSSVGQPETKSAEDKADAGKLVTQVVPVDPKALEQGLQYVTGLTVGGMGLSSGAPSRPEEGVRVVTRTNDMSIVQTAVRDFFETMGIDLHGRDGKTIFYNDRDGTLLVRATPEDVDVIKSAVEVLNTAPPSVSLKAQFADIQEQGGVNTNGTSGGTNVSSPHSYARTNLIWMSRGRQLIRSKLNRIQMGPLKYEGIPLSEVLINLNEQVRKRDPENRGINFIINPNVPTASTTTSLKVDPATGMPLATDIRAADLAAVSVKINSNLQGVTLRDALDAIVAASDKPIKYSIEDYAVVFSAAGTKADWGDPKVPAKPVTPELIPHPEVQTRENAFSTFSLNVSDVAFKLAAASLEKEQMPEPGNIRSEEFINAFDYRDPEAVLPARGKTGVPVAFAWERARYPYAQNRDLLRFSIKTAAQGRQAGRPLNLVLLLDNSGSMERADRVAIIREALKVLASQLQPQDKLSVITFARTAQLRVDGAAGNQAAQVAEEIGGLTPEGGTNIEEAMNLAYQTALRHYLANGINQVVLLTDGAANLGNVEPESLKQKVEANRKQGIALDCFGIGWEGFNDDLLETLSRNGDGRYGFINTPEEAATEFAGQLAGALNVAASDVKVQVEFNPARVTAYRQIGYAKHQLTKEQFRDNTVDAAEIAAQEAGNALYVVEVNPAGQGPLGTVRVRFKVPGTSDYREHEWTVPFNGNAVALEQASPAMRLAATASAFSEWLASSPYATEVTPDTLLRYLGGVPEVYGADGRPKKLEWMIRQAKAIAGK